MLAAVDWKLFCALNLAGFLWFKSKVFVAVPLGIYQIESLCVVFSDFILWSTIPCCPGLVRQGCLYGRDFSMMLDLIVHTDGT